MPKTIVTEYLEVVFHLPWLVASDEGLFAQEGLEVQFLRPKRPAVPKFVEDPRLVDSMGHHRVFEQGHADVYRACEWGQVRRAYDSACGGRIIGKRAAVAVQAIFVQPDSPFTHPQDLRGKKVAVNFHAGSHYITLQMLEGFLERDEIKVIHVGGAQQRYEAMMRGEVDAAALMEPWITLSQKNGCNMIIETHYAGAEIGSQTLDAETYTALNRAIKEAVRRINVDKKKYLHYLISHLPSEYAMQIGPDDFYLPRLRYVDPAPYTEEEFGKTYEWMLSWGLIRPDAAFAQLVDNRISVVF